MLEAVNALESFGCLPFEGGYLNQPITFMRDMQAVRSVLQEHRRQALEEARAVREAMQHSDVPDVPIPPMPERLKEAAG